MELPLPSALLSPVAVLAVIVAAAAWGWVALRSVRVNWRRQRRWQRASAAERDASELLEQVGYVVLGAQVQGSYPLVVDGRAITVSLRADYVVSRGGATYVAEVKSGRRAPLLETAATRRQLLEYLLAFRVRGVLLVDAETRRVREVVFPMRAGVALSARPSRWVWVMLGMGLAAVMAWTTMPW